MECHARLQGVILQGTNNYGPDKIVLNLLISYNDSVAARSISGYNHIEL